MLLSKYINSPLKVDYIFFLSVFVFAGNLNLWLAPCCTRNICSYNNKGFQIRISLLSHVLILTEPLPLGMKAHGNSSYQD